MPKQHTWNRDTLNDGDLLDDEFTNIYQEIENLQDVEGALAQEITDRQNADNLKANKAGDMFTGPITIPNGTLSGHAVNKSQLDLEINTRASVDNSLQSQIDLEVAARINGDNLKVDKSSVVNSDSSTSTVDPVSAYQVKLLKDSITAILGIINSTEADLDTMQEVVNFIQANKDTLDEYATSKVNVADIINDLVSDVSNKPASAHTVFVLKGLLDALETDKANKSDIVDNVTTNDSTKMLSAKQGKSLKDLIDGKANTSHTHAKADITDLTEFVEVNSIPIGMPFPQWFEGNSEAVVTKYPARFIKLSKDLTGSGLYNNGKLGSQTSETTDETKFYLATITDVASPLYNQSITLINSVENTTGSASAQPAFVGAGEVANQKLPNRDQGHYHDLGNSNGTQLPAASLTGGGSYQSYTPVGSSAYLNIDTAINVISDGVNGTPRIGKTTRPDTVTAVYYMRIK